MKTNAYKLKYALPVAALMAGAGALAPAGAWADTMGVGTFGDLKKCLGTDGAVCQLTDDIETEGRVVVQRSVELDLNGHNITPNAEFDLFAVYGGHLNVTGEGTIGTNASYSPFMVAGSNNSEDSNFSTLTVGKDVTLKANDYTIYTDKAKSEFKSSYGAVVDFYGKIDSTYGLYINGTVQDVAENAPIYNIHDGASITTKGHAVYAAGYGIWDFDAAEISAGDGGIGIKAGKFVFDETNVTVTGAYVEPKAWGNGMNASGATFQIESNDAYADNIEIAINSGVYTSQNGHVFYEYKQSENTTNTVRKLTIEDGTFNSAEGKAMFQVSDNFTLTKFISGGEFNAEFPESYVADDYDSDESDNIWTVLPKRIDMVENGAMKSQGTVAGQATFTDEFVTDRKASFVISALNDGAVEGLTLKSNGDLFLPFDATLYDRDGNPVENVNGTSIVVRVMIDEDTYNALKEYSAVKVVYFENSAEVERLDATLGVTGEGEYYVEFTTSHLSTYGIVGVNTTEEEAAAGTPETGTMTAAGASAVSAGAVTLGAVVVIATVLGLAKVFRRK